MSLIDDLKAAHEAAMEMRIDTGPDPVYEGTPASEEAYFEWQRLAWENSSEIIAALEERERLRALVEAAQRVVVDRGHTDPALDDADITQLRNALDALEGKE